MAEPILVVVPTCDRPAMLAEALRSVLAQDDADWVAAVADDGAEPAEGLPAMPRDPRIHWARARAGTAGGARNAGVARGAQALGRPPTLVAFLDDDDLWLPGHLRAMRAALLARPDAVLAHGATVTREGSRETSYHDRDKGPFEGNVFLGLLRRDFVSTSSVLLRGDALRSAGGFRADLRHGEDWALWLALARRSPFAFVPEVTVVNRRHEGNVSLHLLRKIRDQVSVLEAWWRDRAALGGKERRTLRRELARRQRRMTGRRLDEGEARREIVREAWANLRHVPHVLTASAVLRAALGARHRARGSQSVAGT